MKEMEISLGEMYNLQIQGHYVEKLEHSSSNLPNYSSVSQMGC